MEDKIFLIFVGSAANHDVIGCVVGTEEDAIKFCKEHAKNGINWYDIWHEEIDILNPKENIEV